MWTESTPRSAIEYLDIAIDLTLTNATPYYCRAFHKWGTLFGRRTSLEPEVANTLIDIIKDLKIACELAPDWQLANSLLRQVTQKD
jgi:hypothetical protein